MAARKKAAGGELADANKTLSTLVHRVERIEGDRESLAKLQKDLTALHEKLQGIIDAKAAEEDDEEKEPPAPAPAAPPPSEKPQKTPKPRWGFDAWKGAAK